MDSNHRLAGLCHEVSVFYTTLTMDLNGGVWRFRYDILGLGMSSEGEACRTQSYGTSRSAGLSYSSELRLGLMGVEPILNSYDVTLSYRLPHRFYLPTLRRFTGGIDGMDNRHV